MLTSIWWPSSGFWQLEIAARQAFFRLEVFLVSPYRSVSHCTETSLQGGGEFKAAAVYREVDRIERKQPERLNYPEIGTVGSV